MTRRQSFLAFTVLIGCFLLALMAFMARLPEQSASQTAADASADVTPLDKPTSDFANPSLGPQDAPVTVYVFSNYLCPACATMNDLLNRLVADYPKSVRVVWKDYPSRDLNRQSLTAAEAARCAGQQGAFWEYHDLLFSNQDTLGTELYAALAEQLGLDPEEFNRCLTGETSLPLVDRDQTEGIRLRIDATPYVFINARRLSGAPSYEMLRSLVEAELTAAEKERRSDGETK